MLEQFKKVFIICSLDQYQLLSDHEAEILSGLEKYKIVYPFMYGEDIKLCKSVLSERTGISIDDKKFLDLKYQYATKHIKSASKFIYINDIREDNVDESVEAMMELISARKKKTEIISVDKNKLVNSDKKLVRK